MREAALGQISRLYIKGFRPYQQGYKEIFIFLSEVENYSLFFVEFTVDKRDKGAESVLRGGAFCTDVDL